MALAVILKLFGRIGINRSLVADSSRESTVDKLRFAEGLTRNFQKTQARQNQKYLDLVCQGWLILPGIDTDLIGEVPKYLPRTCEVFHPCQNFADARGSSAHIVVNHLRKWLQRLLILKDSFRQLVHQKQVEILFQTEINPKLGSLLFLRSARTRRCADKTIRECGTLLRGLSSTNQASQQLTLSQNLTQIKVKSFSLEENFLENIFLNETNYLQLNISTTRVWAEKYPTRNKVSAANNNRDFLERESETKIKPSLLVCEVTEQNGRLSCVPLSQTLWQERGTSLRQTYQLGDYKYSKIPLLNQPPSSQIYPQIDSSQLKLANKSIAWVNSVSNLNCFKLLSRVLDRYSLLPTNEGLEVSSLISDLWARILTFVKNKRLQINQFFPVLCDRLTEHTSPLINLWSKSQAIVITQKLHTQSLVNILKVASKPYAENLLASLLKTLGVTQLRNISFPFHPDEVPNTLKSILFNVRAGQSIGIVGASGSEETTIINFLTGLHRPSSGKTVIDGCNISRLSFEFLQKQLGLATPLPFLIFGAIFDKNNLYCCEFILKKGIVTPKITGTDSLLQIIYVTYDKLFVKKRIILSRG